MSGQPNYVNYNSVIEVLVSTFGEVLSKDAIISIVENCGGDLQGSAEAIMNITNESNDTSLVTNEILGSNLGTPNEKNEVSLPKCVDLNEVVAMNSTTSEDTDIPKEHGIQALSYARASTSGAVPKLVLNTLKVPNKKVTKFQQIINYHTEGARTLVILRGIPGSGKSFLAKQIISSIYGMSSQEIYNKHIFSADDYFMYRGCYFFDKSRLSDAHMWNKNRTFEAMTKGLSPIIIDNTNIEIWEMEPYVKEGVKNGYILELLEPDTPWAWKFNQLLRKNIHNVQPHTIRRMLDNYQPVKSGEELIKKLGFSYCANMIPPIRREIPSIENNQVPFLSDAMTNVTNPNIDKTENDIENVMKEKIQELQINNMSSESFNNVSEEIQSTNNSAKIEENLCDDESDNGEKNENKDAFIQEVQKRLEEIEKVESEWENGECWEGNFSDNPGNSKSTPEQYQDVKPQRQSKSIKASSESLLTTINKVQDWSEITKYMPSWNETNPATDDIDKSFPIEKVSSSTCIEIGDTDVINPKNSLNIILASPRDINEFYNNSTIEKIPEKRMLDKSTSTNSETIMQTFRCKNEEKHFKEFKKLFRGIAAADLKDVFDNCHGDVNWAVEIVLGGIDCKEFQNIDGDILSESESEGENDNKGQCECLAAYQIIPDQNQILHINTESEITGNAVSPPISEKRKIKKDVTVSDELMQLKQQIEQNVVISDDHYSSHCLKIKKIRRGEFGNENEFTQVNIGDIYESTSDYANLPSGSNVDCTDDETNSSVDEAEKTVSIDISKDMISQLHEHFGLSDITYSKNICTKIDVPVSLLRELNALWIESLLYQLEQNEKQSELMIKQDEDFARDLAQKEEELCLAGKEPETPDFKEIMDVDFALSLYQKDVAQWRNNEPNDIAAKMSREKLHNLFPEVPPNTLSEILMAHDNNFKETVESLLVSTGQGFILEVQDGLSKYIMEKEKEQREKLIQDENNALLEREWPSLPTHETIDMSLVNKYRQEAERYLQFRNMSYQKAADLVRRGMTPAAAYYNELAAYYKMKYEQSNSYAAASLMHLHATKLGSRGNTVDLHYLRVNEAKESLDLFLDEHIKEMRNKTNVKYQKLFFITGRGLHSNGRPKIKPAVKKRLRERGISYTECNPGLLSAKVSADNKMSYQIG